MDERSTGIILRTRPLTETSLVVNWITPDHGRIATAAKGARRPKSPFRGKLDLFYEADFTYARSRRSELHTLRELRVARIHEHLRDNLGYLQQACYAAALLEQTTETDTPLPSLYELLRSFLEHLPRNPAQPKYMFAFELKLLEELGLRPDLEGSGLSPGARLAAQRLINNPWSQLDTLQISGLQTLELRQHLHGFLIYHLGKFPASRAAALQAPE